MAKLKPNAVPAAPDTGGPVQATASQSQAPPPPPPSASNGDPAIPFKVEAPGAANQGTGAPRPNLVQRRQEKIKQALADGSPFTYKENRTLPEFTCICGAQGKNAIVLLDKNGQEVMVGSNCLKHTGVTVPKQQRTAAASGGGSPALSKQQRFQQALAKYTGPFAFVRKEEGPFACLCGGRGSNQIVVRDANGTEFSVGNTCAGLIPGVEIPKQQRQSSSAAPVIAGLKGVQAPPPDFQNVG